MTPKQELFCKEFLVDQNATQAAIRAGYSRKTARAMGCENLTKPDIQAFIQAEMRKKDAKLVASADEVAEYLTKVMRGESVSSVLARCSDGSEVVIEKPPDEKERLSAAEKLGKMHMMFTDKVEQNIDMSPIVIKDDVSE